MFIFKDGIELREYSSFHYHTKAFIPKTVKTSLFCYFYTFFKKCPVYEVRTKRTRRGVSLINSFFLLMRKNFKEGGNYEIK